MTAALASLRRFSITGLMVLAGLEQGDIEFGSLDQLPPGLVGLYLRFFERHFPDASDAYCHAVSRSKRTHTRRRTARNDVAGIERHHG